MSDWVVIWLGIMAVSLAVMTVFQFLALATAVKVARQTASALKEFQREMQPILERALRIADDAARATAAAAAQAERFDDFIQTATSRVDRVLGSVQDVVTGPLRQGSILFAISRAVLAAFGRGAERRAERRRGAREDEDALFVG